MRGPEKRIRIFGLELNKMIFKNEKWINIFNAFLLLAVVMAAIAVISILSSGEKSKSISGEKDSIISVNDGWVRINGDGSLTEFTNFDQSADITDLTISRIFIFDRSVIRNTLSFVVNYCAVEVYQDGILIYSYGTAQDVENGVLIGKYNVSARLDAKPDEASEITVHFMSSHPIKVSRFSLSNGYDAVLSLVIDAIPLFFFSIFSIVLIFAMLLTMLLGRRKYVIPVAYHYFLGFLAVCSIWVFANIKLFGYLGASPAFMSLIGFEALMLMPVIMSIFSYYAIPCLRMLDIVCFFSLLANFSVLNLLHFTKVKSFVQTMPVYYITAMSCIALFLIKAFVLLKRERGWYSTAMVIGLFFLFVGGIAQIVTYRNDSSLFVSIYMIAGLCVFNFVQALTFILNIMSLVGEGRKAGDYLTMAKTDSLTGLANRRGLELYISEIAKNSAPFYRVGCIVCDLNGLKKTNDSYGHSVGDKMLKDFASCLKICFENRGVPFRSGGDEFYVIFSDVEVDMSAMMRRLMIGIEGSNTGAEYKLSCSSGCYADYVPSHDEQAIWDIIKLADAEMYKQKMKDRASQSR